MNKEKVKAGLWGLFIGDALAMPVHWYYNTDNIQKDFPEGINGYKDPKHPHPEAFMVGMKYYPDTETADRGTGFATEHLNITHRSENIASALYITVPLLHELLRGGVWKRLKKRKIYLSIYRNTIRR